MSNFLQEFLLIAVAHAVAVASPGPDFAIVTKQALKYGLRTGIVTAFGVGTAIMLHVTYAVLGFSLLVSQNKVAFTVVKYLGAAFLLYLGVTSLLSKQKQTDAHLNPSGRSLSDAKAFSIGFFTNALNIKAMLFFLMLFTAVVSTSTPVKFQIAYGIWMAVATFAWFSFIAVVFGKGPVNRFFTRWGVWLDRVMGVILIALAVLLVT